MFCFGFDFFVGLALFETKTKMSIEELQELCREFPWVSEDIKWGADLVFSVGSKMFCVIGLEQKPTSASFKVNDEEFEQMSQLPGFKPAPYMARYKWVLVEDISKMSRGQWEKHLQQSYTLVKDKLPLKTRKELGI